MSIELRKMRPQRDWLKLGRKLSVLVLSLSISGLMLSGCATKPLDLSVDCPKPVTVPAQLTESMRPEVQNLAKEVQLYLSDVSNWLQNVP